MADEFTCELCGGTFKKGWSDEEADAEYEATFPNNAEKTVVVCDRCYLIVLGVN